MKGYIRAGSGVKPARGAARQGGAPAGPLYNARVELEHFGVERGQDVLQALAREDFAHLRLRVSGGCLAPHVPDGAYVHLVAPGRRRPGFGDLLLTRTPAGPRLHRLVWPPWTGRARRLRTMADRAASLDPWVSPGDVLGVAVGVERDGLRHNPRRPATAARALWRALRARARRALRWTRQAAA